jgi:hypothetical protein
VLRITVVPQLLQAPVEQLNFKVEGFGDKKGRIVFQWSEIELQIPVESL